MADDIGGVWRTVGGRRIFIKDGQSLSVAMKESGKFLAKLGNKKNINSIELEGILVEKIPPEQIEEKIKDYEKEICGLEVEYSYVIEPDGSVYKFTGNDTNVAIITTKDSIITHNHPIDEDIYRSFGEDDYCFMRDYEFKELRLSNPDYNYSAKKLKQFTGISYNELWREAIENATFSEDFEFQHEIMLLLAKKGYIEYERRNN